MTICNHAVCTWQRWTIDNAAVLGKCQARRLLGNPSLRDALETALTLTCNHLQEEVEKRIIVCERAAADAVASVERAAGIYKMGCRQLQAITTVRAQIQEVHRHASAVHDLLHELETEWEEKAQLERT